MSQLKSQSESWHIQNWGAWGWAETILKLIGIAIAFYGLAISGFNFGFTLNAKLVATILLGLFSLLSLTIVAMRFGQREIISFAFSILSTLGHVSAFLLMLQAQVNPLYPSLFAIAYLLGEATKHQFLNITGYTESGRTAAQMLQIPRVFMAVYLLIAIFAWL